MSAPPSKVKRDDFLALLALLIGAAIAFIGRKVVIELAGGAALGLGGVLLAVRGGKPIAGRGWMVCALALGGLAFSAVTFLGFYQEWEAGQWFAQGPQTAMPPDAIRNLYRTVSALRIGGLAGGLCFLLGGLVNWLSASGNEKGPEKPPGPSQ
jgi:hypothetical protein